MSQNGVLASVEAFRAYLRGLVEASTLTVVAEAYGVSASYLCDLMQGRGSIGPGAAKRFGYRRETTHIFIPLDEPLQAALRKQKGK